MRAFQVVLVHNPRWRTWHVKNIQLEIHISNSSGIELGLGCKIVEIAEVLPIFTIVAPNGNS